jgi:hypothetical protein
MADDTTRKGVLLPLQHNGQGGIRGIYKDDKGVSLREFRPVEEGKPIMGELAKLTPREESRLMDAEIMSLPSTPVAPTSTTGHEGPAKVNSEAYRQGYDRIFGKKQTTGEA